VTGMAHSVQHRYTIIMSMRYTQKSEKSEPRVPRFSQVCILAKEFSYPDIYRSLIAPQEYSRQVAEP
jgi:hypothetical protein